MSYYISKDPDYELVFEDALFYSFGLRMPMPKLIFTEHASRNMSHMKDKTVCIVGLGYVGLPKLFCKQKPLLKKCLRHFLLRKKKYFFGKAFKTFLKKGLL